MLRRLVTVGLTVVTLGACGKDDAPTAVSGTVTVFAAASLTGTAQQINQGARSRRLASAATKNMARSPTRAPRPPS
jgi:ABC-type molybdate transport system substrate-binding protein